MGNVMTEIEDISTGEPPTVGAVQKAIRLIGDDVQRRSEELSGSRRVPDDLYEAIARCGLFRQLVPRELGGVGATPAEWFANGVELASCDASVGWVVTQGAAELGWIANGGDPAWAVEVLADPLAASASTIAGQGTLTVDGDSGVLEGRWGFNTGCFGATWIGGQAAVMPVVEGEEPDYRFAWVPADRAEILDDWNPTGLRGTGSNSIVIPTQTIPLAWTVSTFQPTDNDRGPYRTMVGNGNWPIACSVAAVQLGASRRALDEAQLALGHKIEPTGPLTHNASIQVDFMQIQAQWHAAHSFMERELATMWEHAERNGELPGTQRVRINQAATNANRTAVEVIHVLTRLTGTTTVDPSHPLSRCSRDVLALQGHIGTCRRSIEMAAEYQFGIRDTLLRLV
jgi:alkylation response protein AidB-like acyl-CoA dehydrogenase